MKYPGNVKIGIPGRGYKRKAKEPVYVRCMLIGAVFVIFLFIIGLPLALVITEALRRGWTYYLSSLNDPAAYSAIMLTLKVALVVVPLNTMFGIAAAWAITRFSFRGKSLLAALIDLPFAVSPVVAGLLFVIVIGSNTPLGAWLADHGIKVIFALPGIILATLFVTFPFIARELIPLMQSIGTEEEEAAVILGASGLKTFFLVTLPNIKWGLLYGIVLCNARAIGEFGAVSVVSGHIRGQTNTVPLQVEILYSEYRITAAFALSSVLVVFALISLAIKRFIERRYRMEMN